MHAPSANPVFLANVIPASIVTPADRILITGSNGFIGAKVVERLLDYGYVNLRCFVRPSSSLNRLQRVLDARPGARNVQIISGDLLSPADCRAAGEAISIVYHLAAGIEKTF